MPKIPLQKHWKKLKILREKIEKFLYKNIEKIENLKGKNRKIPLQKHLNFKGKSAEKSFEIFSQNFAFRVHESLLTP